jgi:hypothetical protein
MVGACACLIAAVGALLGRPWSGVDAVRGVGVGKRGRRQRGASGDRIRTVECRVPAELLHARQPRPAARCAGAVGQLVRTEPLAVDQHVDRLVAEIDLAESRTGPIPDRIGTRLFVELYDDLVVIVRDGVDVAVGHAVADIAVLHRHRARGAFGRAVVAGVRVDHAGQQPAEIGGALQRVGIGAVGSPVGNRLVDQLGAVAIRDLPLVGRAGDPLDPQIALDARRMRAAGRAAWHGRGVRHGGRGRERCAGDHLLAVEREDIARVVEERRAAVRAGAFDHRQPVQPPADADEAVVAVGVVAQRQRRLEAVERGYRKGDAVREAAVGSYRSVIGGHGVRIAVLLAARGSGGRRRLRRSGGVIRRRRGGAVAIAGGCLRRRRLGRLLGRLILVRRRRLLRSHAAGHAEEHDDSKGRTQDRLAHDAALSRPGGRVAAGGVGSQDTRGRSGRIRPAQDQHRAVSHRREAPALTRL